MDLLSLVVSIIVFALILGLVYWALSLLPLPQPFKQILLVAIVVLFVIVLLLWLFGGYDAPISLGARG